MVDVPSGNEEPFAIANGHRKNLDFPKHGDFLKLSSYVGSPEGIRNDQKPWLEVQYHGACNSPGQDTWNKPEKMPVHRSFLPSFRGLAFHLYTFFGQKNRCNWEAILQGTSASRSIFWGKKGHDGPSLVEAVPLSPQDATLGGAKQQLKIRWVHHDLRGQRGSVRYRSWRTV